MGREGAFGANIVPIVRAEVVIRLAFAADPSRMTLSCIRAGRSWIFLCGRAATGAPTGRREHGLSTWQAPRVELCTEIDDRAGGVGALPFGARGRDAREMGAVASSAWRADAGRAGAAAAARATICRRRPARTSHRAPPPPPASSTSNLVWGVAAAAPPCPHAPRL